jgi:hypothetical protein
MLNDVLTGAKGELEQMTAGMGDIRAQNTEALKRKIFYKRSYELK